MVPPPWTVRRQEDQKPLARLFAYMRLAPGAYVLGGILTLLYAAFFQLIPLSIRDIVAAFENAPDEVGRAILWLVVASVCLALARLFSRIVMFNIGRQIEYRIRNDYSVHLQSLPQSFYLAQPHRRPHVAGRERHQQHPDVPGDGTPEPAADAGAVRGRADRSAAGGRDA